MSISVVSNDWNESAFKNAQSLTNTIVNNKPVRYLYWNFCDGEIVDVEENMEIIPWLDYDDKDTALLFQEFQYKVLSFIGKNEIKNGTDLSYLKRQFMVDVIESTQDGKFNKRKALEQLKEKYTIDDKMLALPEFNYIYHSDLFGGMFKYDSTNNFNEPRNKLFFGRGDSYDARIKCAKLYNYLADNKTNNIGKNALLLAGYSGIANKLLVDFKVVDFMLEHIRNQRWDFDNTMVDQLHYCVDSMLLLLGSITNKRDYEKQYLECMMACYIFGSCCDSWSSRNSNIKW